MTSRRYHHTGHVVPSFEIVSPVRSPGSVAAHVNYWSPALERALREQNVTQVAITGWWKERGPGLRFLAAFADQIRHLLVADETVRDLSVVSELEHLESLSVRGAVEGIDFARLPRLRACALADADSAGNVAASPSLRELALDGVGIHDLGSLAPLGTLRALSLRSLRRLVTLDGVEALPLEELELDSLELVRSIAPVTRLGSLRVLATTGGRRAADFERIGEVSSLETLKIVSGPDLSSFELVDGLPRLEEFGMWGTTLAGARWSVSPLARLPRLRVLRLSGGAKRLERLADVERVGEIRSLEALSIDRGPELPSIEFLRGLTSLRDVGFRRTRIRDGDFGVLLELPRLERVRISPHLGHYSHRAEALSALLRAVWPDTPMAAAEAERERFARALAARFDRLAARHAGPRTERE